LSKKEGDIFGKAGADTLIRRRTIGNRTYRNREPHLFDFTLHDILEVVFKLHDDIEELRVS
jgi:hypothetical protein